MSILKTLTFGALGYLAYQAWQRRQGTTPARTARAVRDAGGRTPPHGDRVHVGGDDVAPMPRTSTQASPGSSGT